jgi:hypothetical protein
VAYEVVKDRVDYTWVLTQQIERVARIATRYHQTPRARRGEVLAALRGAVEVLLDLAEPVVKDNLGTIRAELARAEGYRRVMDLFMAVVASLQRAKLLVKVQKLEEEW